MKIRRALIILFVALTIFFISTCASYFIKPAPGYHQPTPWSGEPLVTTVYGRIQGYADRDHTFSWKGIPYALAPVGDLRWKKPERHWPWINTLSAGGFGSEAVQFLSVMGNVMGSEDCLYLNVWRPASEEGNLPVYVFIHGGGNSIGSANAVSDYYGNGVASKSNMVFVSMNYRLGAFGWFYHPALAEGRDPADDSGNFGTLDIIAALSWVKENISVFGGDPERVTIAGHSSGGMNVLALLTSPGASGLFQRAIVESGYDMTVTTGQAMAYSQELTAKLLVRDHRAPDDASAKKLASEMPKEELRRYLYRKSAKELMEVQNHDFLGMTGIPAIIADGFVVPKEGGEVFEAGAWPNKVPLIIGTNRDETRLFLHFLSPLDWRTAPYDSVADYGSRRWKAQCADEIATRMTRAPGAPPVYVYRFDWGSIDRNGKSPFSGDWGKKLGAFHTIEIPFFLGTDTILGYLMTRDLFTDANRKQRENLTRVVMRRLANFAATGDPNPGDAGAVKWKPWNQANGETETLIFNSEGDSPALRSEPGNHTVREIDDTMKKDLDEPSMKQAMMGLSQGSI